MKPCPRCARLVGHMEWCPELFSGWCICQTSVVPLHRFGDHPRCLYVADWAMDPNRDWRGIFPPNLAGLDVQDCHWPHPVERAIVLRAKGCAHGTYPWEYAK